MIEDKCKFFRPLWSPCPDCRRHIVDFLYRKTAQPLDDTEAKGRCVHRYQDIGMNPPNVFGGLPHSPNKMEPLGQDLGNSHDREFAHWEQALEPFALHRFAADAVKRNRAIRHPLDRRHQTPCQ